MTPIEENAVMSSDLDCKNQDLLRIRNFFPTPSNLVHPDDPRLSDPRMMLPGSVTDESVANHAAIVQSKLNLNGVMPPNWFSPTPPVLPPGLEIDAPAPIRYPAHGELAEMLSRKGVANGYAPIDDNLRLLPANVTPGPGPGSVTEVLFSFPDQFDHVPVTGISTTSSITWKSVPGICWFGVYGATLSPFLGPTFHEEQFPLDLIPPIDASKFTTGLFEPDVLPIAQFGDDHAPGMVPDPGDTGDGDPDEYLGRDMDWHHFDANHFYQPYVDKPTITLISIDGGRATVTIRTEVPGSILFTSIGRLSFRESPSEFTVHVLPGTLIQAYAAKEGYNNSGIVSYTVPLEDIPDIIEIPAEA